MNNLLPAVLFLVLFFGLLAVECALGIIHL